MDYNYSFVMEETMGLGILSSLFSGFPAFALSVVGYILSALALYTLAKRRGINHPWLSWVPVASVWILGSLSDQYRYVVRGQNKAKRKVLLTLNILSSILAVAMVAAAVVLAVKAVSGMMSGIDDRMLLENLAGLILGVCGLLLPIVGVAIAYAVIYFMALYDVFTSVDPDNSVVFLVLSILFNVTEPFFLFFNRNKDKGMPPRRSEPETYIPFREPERQAPQEPWETENKDYL